MTELTPYTTVIQDNAPDFRKKVSVVFARDAILTSHKEISDQFKRLLLKIETETELIQKDNLSRGELIDSARVGAILRSGSDNKHRWWDIEDEKMKCEFGENDPPKYWGEIGLYTDDFIASSNKYPWMPSSISKDEFPF